MLRLLLFLCWLAILDASKARLVRVVVLARHGNRAPNPQVEMLCPTYFEKVLPKFGVPPAALSPVGMAENWESGVFLAQRYRDFLPSGPFMDDGAISVMSERMSRNIVSMEALTLGMFPTGTGVKGFLQERPNLVPIATTQAGVDQLLNCPRDGPCRPRFKADFNSWTAENDGRVFGENEELFHRISRACGYELRPEGIEFKGKAKTLTWAAKAVSDAFTFAANEGLDPTIDGRISHEDIQAFKHVAGSMVKGSRFGTDQQMTYWVSNFLPTVLKLATLPNARHAAAWVHNRLHLFLNHRELVYASAHVLGIPIAYPGLPVDVLPAGCMLLFEIYEKDGESFMKFFWWGPSHPDAQDINKAKGEDSVAELYKHGNVIPTAPHGCNPDELCPLAHVKALFDAWTNQTGTYQQICGLDGEEELAVSRLVTPGAASWFAMPAVVLMVAGIVLWNVANKQRRHPGYTELV
eukprot:TRINITY_DN7998_c0_g1_i1.p1 TRINITY_DN7998_c0_g1~~TRINITY_DN7998_c0_g1_i1.p1  ORF type:complete len:484 (+),score=99.77 TRINITY_DN7998_c0_g1_i1:57-1454(+)